MIEYDTFLEWAESRFGGDVIVKGDEIKLNSIFCEDYKHHMWCNPYGGKKERPFGVFHCWKTDMKGSLVTLVMKVDNCSFDEALEVLGVGSLNHEEIQKKIDAVIGKHERKEVEPEQEQSVLRLPPHTYAFDELPSYSYHRVHGEIYLFNRGLTTDNLLVCTAGEYKSRIIIPYYSDTGELIYFNGRYIGESKKLRYMGPPKDIGVGKGDVLYFPAWPQPGSIVHLTEGEFDALSIHLSEHFSAAFGGKHMTETQVGILRDRSYRPVICLDTDAAGTVALITVGDMLLAQGIHPVSYVRTPAGIKDWNEMLQKYNSKVLSAYIGNNTKEYDEMTSTKVKTSWL